jgi:hypothetical protein
MKNKSPNPQFCMAPWTHTYLSPQSERRICCASREQASWQKQYIDRAGDTLSEYDPETLEDYWNGEKMKSVRKRLLNGEKIPECQVCNENILNLYTYKDYFTKTLFPHKIDEAINSTASDGSTTMKTISFDYRISNLCTFKCRMCGELLSSAWEGEKRALNLWNPESDKWMLPENKLKIEKFQKEVAEIELWDAVKKGTIEEIYWVGGEPLLYQIHWDIMKYLIDSGKSKQVIVRYNTNLNRIVHKGIHLYELLPHFKHVNMCCSMDATGLTAEWIRTGLNWCEWLSNFKAGLFLNKQFGMDSMVIDVTITLPGLLDMKNLIRLAAELNVKSYVKITFDFDASILMSPMCLPRSILNELCDELIAFENQIGNEFTKVYSETFTDMKNRPNFEEKYPDWKPALGRGKSFIQKIAQYRNDKDKLTIEQIFSNHPKISKWWSDIK